MFKKLHTKYATTVFMLVATIFSGVAFADLYGYVKNPAGIGLSGVTVSLESSGAHAVTNSNGYYNILTSSTTSFKTPAYSSQVSFGNGFINFSLSENSNVKVNAYTVLGREIFSSGLLKMNIGANSIKLFEHINPGIYIINLRINSENITYKVNFTKNDNGIILQKNIGALKKIKSEDYLNVSYESDAIEGKIPVLSDNVDDIVLTQKNVVGSIAQSVSLVNVSLIASSGESYKIEANISNGKYLAKSKWMLFSDTRTWTILANEIALKNIKDDVQTVTIDIPAELKTINYSYNTSLEANENEYSFVTVDLNAQKIADALSINKSELEQVSYYAIKANGELDSISTANAPGHWFNKNGDVCEYGDNAYLYSELDLSNMKANVGQFPGKVLAGEMYTIKQAVKSKNTIVYFTINVTIKQSMISSSSEATSSSISSSSVATTITMASLAQSAPDRYKFVNWEWDYRLSANGIQSGSDGTYDDYRIESARNWTFYQIVDNGGYLNFCVRWQSTEQLTRERREQITQMLDDEINLWAEKLIGFEGWPYGHIKVNVTGWAVLDANIVKDKQSNEIVYSNYSVDDPQDGFDYNITNSAVKKQPMCPDACSRSNLIYGSIANYNNCPNYSKTNDTHFDQFIQPVAASTASSPTNWGFATGTGEGLWINDSYLISTLGQGLPHIVVHESGHNWGLPDFYEAWDFPNESFSSPMSKANTANASYVGIGRSMVMNAGSNFTVTEDDAWLLRKIWYEIKKNLGM